ncbi:putative pectinesterase inhibitor domain-containing protein [Helianthus annuus]|nr:putative pectinesterase inhibitor domain-containing protein [Helianthus annuus]
MTRMKRTLNLVSIFALFLFTQCPKVTSARTSAPAPSPIEDEVSPTIAPTTILSDLTADNPLSSSELFELSLPDIGVQKAAVTLQSEGAKVANKQLEGIERKIEDFKAILAKRQAGSGSEASKKCLTQCDENLEDAIDGVKISIESINNQDLETANMDISGIAADIEACNDCFLDSDGEDKDVNAFNEWIQGVTKECVKNLKEK